MNKRANFNFFIFLYGRKRKRKNNKNMKIKKNARITRLGPEIFRKIFVLVFSRFFFKKLTEICSGIYRTRDRGSENE
jgi:hypothetical protein